jgi:hypothetical protein
MTEYDQAMRAIVVKAPHLRKKLQGDCWETRNYQVHCCTELLLVSPKNMTDKEKQEYNIEPSTAYLYVKILRMEKEPDPDLEKEFGKWRWFFEILCTLNKPMDLGGVGQGLQPVTQEIAAEVRKQASEYISDTRFQRKRGLFLAKWVTPDKNPYCFHKKDDWHDTSTEAKQYLALCQAQPRKWFPCLSDPFVVPPLDWPLSLFQEKIDEKSYALNSVLNLIKLPERALVKVTQTDGELNNMVRILSNIPNRKYQFKRVSVLNKEKGKFIFRIGKRVYALHDGWALDSHPSPNPFPVDMHPELRYADSMYQVS